MRALPSIILSMMIILIITRKFICPFYFLFDIPCPGCGMTRAYLALLKLDFYEALHYHGLFPVPFFWAIYQLCRKYIKINRLLENILLILSVFLFFIRWITILIT